MSKAVKDLEFRIIRALRAVESCNVGPTSYWAGKLAREILAPGSLDKERAEKPDVPLGGRYPGGPSSS